MQNRAPHGEQIVVFANVADSS